ncbi:MAG TPA: hypothetical protein VMY34_07020, partial [Acidimicrobiales bacterium]|nr:hypothetical protein [Acidimicrobiales bacterium]
TKSSPPTSRSSGTLRPGAAAPSGSSSGGTTTIAAAADDSAGGPVGSFARTLLQPRPATRLVVDVLVQKGADYRAANLQHTVDVLREVTGKPVDVAGPFTFSSEATSHSADAIRSLAAAHGRTPQGSGVAALRLLVLRGKFADGAAALGVAVQGEVIAIFPEQTERASTIAVSRQRIEEAVLTHEMGHLLGLVDLVIDRNRDDGSHPGHSKNSQSVMYWAIDSDVITQVLDGPPPIELDSADRTDLAAIRAGG